MTTVDALTELLSPHGLMVAGVARVDAQSIILVAPDEPAFWGIVTQSPEWSDGAPDPIDRWSKRILGSVALAVKGHAVFPSDGPPFAPFYSWACASGQVWPSPVSLLVHDVAGLFVSFRGAIAVPSDVQTRQSRIPCTTCETQPCATACPPKALTTKGYDVARCHAFLATKEGSDCRNGGCLVRRACPVGQSRRLAEQSKYHMGQFHK